MIYPRQIPLTQRKALCGRLLYLDAVNQLRLALPRDNSSYKTFTRLLLEHIELAGLNDKQQKERERAATVPPMPLKALDCSLRDAIDSFKNAPAYAHLSGDPPSKTLMNSLTASVSSLSCQQCSSGNAICQGVAQGYDDGLVHLKGACITQLRQIFEVARDAAQGYYAEYTQDFPSSSFPEIVLATGTVDVPEKKQPLDDFYAGAVTKFIDEPGQARTEIQLRLMVDERGFKLDLYTYKGISYVMFHECIAHAFYGLVPNFKDRKTSDPFDPFSEGFMDQVAFEVLKEAVEDTGLAKNLNLKKPIIFSDSLKAAGKMYFERNDCSFEEIAPNTAYFALGVKAAETSLNLIKKAYKTTDFGPAEDFKRGFYRLAFHLNTRSDIDKAERREFVTLMYTYYVLSTIEPEKRDYATNMTLLEIEGAIVNYLRTGTITDLLMDAHRLTNSDDSII